MFCASVASDYKGGARAKRIFFLGLKGIKNGIGRDTSMRKRWKIRMFRQRKNKLSPFLPLAFRPSYPFPRICSPYFRPSYPSLSSR